MAAPPRQRLPAAAGPGRWPVEGRSTCGTSSPTNPMTPVTAVAGADAERRAGHDVAARVRKRRCRGSRAASSPERQRIERAAEPAAPMPASIRGAPSHTCVRLRSASEPIIQNTISTDANGIAATG